MREDELIRVLIFNLFWFVIYLTEGCCVLYFFRKKMFPRSRLLYPVHFLAFAGVVCLLYGYLIEPRWIETTHVTIVTPKLHKAELTIVQISDMHCEEPRNEKRMVSIINQLKPDVILYTGDSLNTGNALPLFRETLSSLYPEAGKYAVRGNFDVAYWKELPLFQGTGFTELDGKTAAIDKDGERFTVSGLNAGHASGLAFLNSLTPDTYNIMLYHYPGMNERVGTAKIDLFLSGHTHGGQVALPLYGAVITISRYGKKYESGRYDINGKVVYVNRGMGMEAGNVPRVRFLARPEITVFHIKPAGKESDKK